MCCSGVLISGQDWRSDENDEGFGLVGLYKNGTEYKYRQTLKFDQAHALT